MKLCQHAFSPLWPHFGTTVSTYPVQHCYPYKPLHAQLKGIYRHVETIEAGLSRIRQAADFETEADSWQMVCNLMHNVLHEMPCILGAPPTLGNMLRLIAETKETLENIPRELERLEAENYFGYTPALFDIQNIVGFPYARLEDSLPPDICPPGNNLCIDKLEFDALCSLSKLRKAYPLIGGGCGLTPETAILLPAAITKPVHMQNLIFSTMCRTKLNSQACISVRGRHYNILMSKAPYQYPIVLWVDLTEHRPSW